MECVATFDTTYMALLFEKTCKKLGCDVKIIPVPRTLSASCGLACSYACGEEEKIRSTASAENIEVAGYHKL
ncbi:MAG: DUF3343 domain-containing protein [Synergistaceae bacterium]|nr:DUF3343 domain-containing protein [Synergistaceae bacterium]